MSKETLRDTPNEFWGHRTPPADCCLTIYCGSLDRSGFRRYIKDLAKAGLYYRHDWSRKEVTLAFKDAKMRKYHEDTLRLNAKAEGMLLEKNPNDIHP